MDTGGLLVTRASVMSSEFFLLTGCSVQSHPQVVVYCFIFGYPFPRQFVSSQWAKVVLNSSLHPQLLGLCFLHYILTIINLYMVRRGGFVTGNQKLGVMQLNNSSETPPGMKPGPQTCPGFEIRQLSFRILALLPMGWKVMEKRVKLSEPYFAYLLKQEL